MEVKIIHTGDIHLGSAFGGLSPDKALLRQTELIDGFRRLCAYAKDNGVFALLIAGDLFDGTPSPRLVKEVFSIIEESKPVCVFYCSGNHDGGFAIQKMQNLPENLYLFSQNHGWQSYDLPENVTVTGIDGQYLEDGKYENLRLRGERFNILLLHGDIRGDGKDGVNLARLQNKHIDYLALGHIHIPMQTAARLDGRGKYRYCGCMEGRGFDEIGARGCFLLEVKDNRLTKESFLTLSRREVAEKQVDISACTGYRQLEDAVLNALHGVKREDMVKVILCGGYQAGLHKDLPLLSERLNEHFFHAKVVDKSTLAIDYAAFEKDFSERGEFVREVLRGVSNEEARREILEVGLKALAGEEIDL